MQTQRTQDRDLVLHLLDSGGDLWVPGADPHTRTGPVPFTVIEDSMPHRPHPLNPAQAPVLIGTIPAFNPCGMGMVPVTWSAPATSGDEYWCVALPHLAHTRGECERCEPVWTSAADEWSDTLRNGRFHHPTLFVEIILADHHSHGLTVDGSTISLLSHLDDIPDDWYNPPEPENENVSTAKVSAS